MQPESQEVVSDLPPKDKEDPRKECSKCHKKFLPEHLTRHELIHEVAVQYSEKELLAQIALNTSEIKLGIDQLVKAETYRLRKLLELLH